MRIKVKLYSEKETLLDMNYNYYLSSMIYSLLSKSNSEYSRKLHEEGYMINNKRFKLFTFSNLFPERFDYLDNYLKIKGNGLFYITSPKREFILHLAEGLLSSKNLKVADCDFDIHTVEILPEPVFEREMRFTCLSPISVNTVEVENGKRKAISCMPGTPKFAENIKNNLVRKYCLLNKRLPKDMSLELTFNEKDLEKYGRGKLIKFKEVFIKAYSIPFKLKGSTELMKVGYECGFGEKNSAGFGMVETIKGRKKDTRQGGEKNGGG